MPIILNWVWPRFIINYLFQYLLCLVEWLIYFFPLFTGPDEFLQGRKYCRRPPTKEGAPLMAGVASAMLRGSPWGCALFFSLQLFLFLSSLTAVDASELLHPVSENGSKYFILLLLYSRIFNIKYLIIKIQVFKNIFSCRIE